MIWCRFQADGVSGAGLVEGDRVVAVDGDPFDAYTLTDTSYALADVRLLPPTQPRTFFCVGMNYRAHIAHAQERGNTSVQVPERPEVGFRTNNALIGHEDDIVVPGDLEGLLEAEPEVAAVIGRPLRRASRDEALEGILGWTIGNDVSARGWQRSDRTFWRAKNSDTFKPMGPWIVTDVDPMDATTSIRVNGAEVMSFATGDMIFDALDYIVEITKYLTMSPGDVLWMGADGTAEIVPGDVVEIDVSGIGTLRNPVVAEAA
jgi:2-keto-4-pentenoate hydratase/2-oxohepta-3-ene-1,7-dioic acid hydratase in catechol pathway